jgi:hypothetical protein
MSVPTVTNPFDSQTVPTVTNPFDSQTVPTVTNPFDSQTATDPSTEETSTDEAKLSDPYTEETSTDEAKLSDPTQDWILFGTSLFNSMFFLSVFIFLSSMSMYTTLIAEAKMLKFNVDNPLKMPIPIETKDVFTNIIKIYSGFPPHLDKMIKSKIHFNPSDVTGIHNNFVINQLQSSKITIIHAIKTILFSMINNNYEAINMICGLFYQLPECVAMYLFMFFTPFMLFVLFFVNIGLCIVTHFISIKEFFKSNIDDVWKVDFFPINIFINAFILFIYVFYFMFSFTIFWYPFIAMAYCYLSPFRVFGINTATSKETNFIEFLIDIVTYKRQFIMWLISILLLRSTLLLGTYSVVGCLVTIICLALFTNVYSQYIPECYKTKI